MTRKLSAIIFAIFSIIAFAKHTQATGTNGALFLNVGYSARAEGMGGAYAAVANDASAVTINPAGMVQIKGQQVALMHNEYFLGVNQEYVAYVTKWGERAFGVSLIYMDDTQASYSSSNAYLGSFENTSTALTLAYARDVTKDLSAGASFKYIKSKLGGDYSDSTFAIDAGVLYKTPVPGLTAAAVLTNVGGKLKLYQASDPLPATLKLAGAYQFQKIPLLVDTDLYMINDESPEIHVGAQYTVAAIIPIRVGYNNMEGVLDGFTYGIGLKQKDFAIDYAFIPAGDFEDTHRFSVLFNLK